MGQLSLLGFISLGSRAIIKVSQLSLVLGSTGMNGECPSVSSSWFFAFVKNLLGVTVIFVYLHVCACFCVYLCTMCIQKPVKVRGALDTLKLELNRAVRYQWVLRTELGSFARAASALNL